MFEPQSPENEIVPCERRRRDLLNFESPSALPGLKSTKLAIRIHGNRQSSLQLKCVTGTMRSSKESGPWDLPESDGGKTTRIKELRQEKQLLGKFKYYDNDYTTVG